MKTVNCGFIFQGGVANGKIDKNILFCRFSKNGIMNVWGI